VAQGASCSLFGTGGQPSIGEFRRLILLGQFGRSHRDRLGGSGETQKKKVKKAKGRRTKIWFATLLIRRFSLTSLGARAEILLSRKSFGPRGLERCQSFSG